MRLRTADPRAITSAARELKGDVRRPVRSRVMFEVRPEHTGQKSSEGR
jgi:hypothetical protein